MIYSFTGNGCEFGRFEFLVVEDRQDTREWLIGVAQQAFPGSEVAAAGSLRDAGRWLDEYKAAGRTSLRVAMVDLGLPDGSGVDFVRRLRAEAPEATVVVATIYDDDAHLFGAIAGGAQGYVLKYEDAETMVARLRRIAQGEPPLSPSIAQRILERMQCSSLHPGRRDAADLTPREIEVLTLLAKGFTNAEVAGALGLKPQTVASYVKVLYQKLGVSNRAGAALAAADRALA